MTAVPEPRRQLALNLRRAMAEKGVSVTEVAARADIYRTHLSLILRGERTVQLDTLVKLAGALEISPRDLLAGIEWVPDGKGGGEFRGRGRNAADRDDI
jgi:transcriptional regulator with XRE-family HTH domain